MSNLGKQPAFPYTYDYHKDGQHNVQVYPGMDIRTHLAGLAMQGLLAANLKETYGNREMPVPSYIAECAVDIADELLKQLEL